MTCLGLEGFGLGCRHPLLGGLEGGGVGEERKRHVTEASSGFPVTLSLSPSLPLSLPLSPSLHLSLSRSAAFPLSLHLSPTPQLLTLPFPSRYPLSSDPEQQLSYGPDCRHTTRAGPDYGPDNTAVWTIQIRMSAVWTII